MWRGFFAGRVRLKGYSAAWGDRGQLDANLRSWLSLCMASLGARMQDGGQLRRRVPVRNKKSSTSKVYHDGLVMFTRFWCQVSLGLCLCTGHLLFLGGWYKGSCPRTAPRQIWGLYPITGITHCILTLVASVLDSLLNQARFCSPSMPEAAEIACEAQQALMHRAGAPGSFELLRGLWPCRADALDDGSCKHRVGAGQARSQRSEIGARNKASV